MRLEIIERTRQMADHIIATGATVRATAEKFGISKSTVHKDMTERLYYVDRKKYYLVQAALQKNLAERHIRGGLSTRLKYRLKHKRTGD
ncbi:MAG TPA: sporulation transcriptional regulator SpoIIID [Firmicutes bacterium]|nr:sporulation transcriptional regulator SpoIIID [Bacillota bacterium]